VTLNLGFDFSIVGPDLQLWGYCLFQNLILDSAQLMRKYNIYFFPRFMKSSTMTRNNATPISLDCTDLVLSQAEMTDGIITTIRLEEIISAIATANPYSSKEGKPDPNPNCNDVLTRWYNLVHAVTATSDEHCIQHFVEKLNGLALITDWAHTAQTLGNDVTIAEGNEGHPEKLIISLLNLLNRLRMETYMLSDGGILSVLKELGMSKSSIIREMSLALQDKWRPAKVSAGSNYNLTKSTIAETSESVKDEPKKTNHNVSGSPLKGVVQEEEKEEEAEEQMNNPSDPISPAYSSDSGSVPDRKAAASPTEKEKKVETVYDDDMDALEIARQVAIQVEEEVVQYRETLCSSPEEETQPAEVDLPLNESIEVKIDQNAVDQTRSIPPFREEDSVLTTGTLNEGAVKASKTDGSGLDLNENLCVDYETTPELIHVSASKGVPPSSSIPVTSCRFGAGIAAGWTGTAAATSAFRAASPRSGIHLSADRSSTGTPIADSMGLKRSSSCLEFDLNVAEINTAEVILPPSGDSSTEVSSERAKRLRLDLNCANEDEVVEPILTRLPQKPMLSHVFQDHGHSSASSSSLLNQAKFDFDLNDDPSSRKDEGQNDNSVKLMGWNMTGGNVPRNQTTPPMFHSFLGPNAAPSQFGSLSGPTNLYHSHMLPSSSYGYQYNAVPQVWFGQPSTSYAVPRHLVPQMLGPISENGPSVGLSLMSGDRSNLFRSGLDLNASTGSMEATSREVVGFRQFFVQNHSGLVQEPVINSTAQPAVQTPGNGVRWREQERERETFSYGFKQLI
jgi:hypothetical protein